ncbi:MAG: hypothetical protein ABI639_00340 [Thermoanaerobaculia bacterium]
MSALALAFQLVVLGLHVVVPWRLGATSEPPADAKEDPRKRLWALLAAPLLLAAALAGLFALGQNLDAAIAWGFVWPPASVPAFVILLASLALLLTDFTLLVGFRKLEPLGFRVASGLAIVLLCAASVGGELLRVGRGPAAGLASILLAATGRAALALAAGEAAAGAVSGFALLAGIALPLSVLGFPEAIRAALQPDFLTLGAAALLLLLARFVPPSLRRPAVFAALVLAAIFLDRTRDLSGAFEPMSRIPDIVLPEP